ncbi:MAG: hypothetical protein HYY06_30500 [Deltaproteobacteria bacterium]|nr:hypothetical protein [Deltaproteobacteria bacterium]
MAAMKLAAVGEICEDLYLPAGVGRPGGIASNFAFHAARAGAHALLFGALGDDEAGHRLAEALAVSPVDAAGVRRIAGRSTIQRLRVEAGERVFCGYEAGVAEAWSLGMEDREQLSSCEAIACSDGLRSLLEACLAIGPPVVCDFSRDTDGNDPQRPEQWLRPWLDRLAIAFVGGELSFEGRLEALGRTTDTLIVLTAGPHGALAWHRGHAWSCPSAAETVVDTNGCGDAFQAGFTVAWAQGADVEEALAAGASAAAFVAGAWGAQPR